MAGRRRCLRPANIKILYIRTTLTVEVLPELFTKQGCSQTRPPAPFGDLQIRPGCDHSHRTWSSTVQDMHLHSEIQQNGSLFRNLNRILTSIQFALRVIFKASTVSSATSTNRKVNETFGNYPFLFQIILLCACKPAATYRIVRFRTDRRGL